MKYRTTKKAMRESYEKILGVSYCALQSLLRFTEPIAYSTRREGWACDYYDVDGVLISTGYAPLKSRCTPHADYDLINAYEQKARKIFESDLPYDERKKQINSLLHEFIEKVS